MKNEIYEADYRRREERSEFPNAFDDAVMTGFFKAYGDIMRSIPKMIVPQDKKNYEELLLKLDALAKRRHGSIRGVVSYERWDSHIYVTLPFFEFSDQEEHKLLGSMERDSIFKLHRPPVVAYLMYGKTGYENRMEQMRLQDEAERNTEAYKKIMGIRFEELDLSIRAFNCLRRAGYETIGDIVDLTEEDIIHIKNISWKQYDEIGRKLLARGVSESAWIGFIQDKI